MSATSNGGKTKKKHPPKHVLLIWLEFIPFLILYKSIRLMPLALAYMINKVLFRILFLVDAKHRNRAISHILHAGVAKDEKQARVIAWQAFLSFSKLLVEIIKLNQCFSPDKVKFTGSESAIRDACMPNAKNTNVIIVTAHYGNWEMAGSAWAHLTGIPMVSIMRPFNNPLIGKYILSNRESGVHQSIDKEGGIRGLLRALKEGKTIAILADQHAGTNEGIETTFFGQPCRTHTSPALLHLKTGVPILPELNRRLDDHGHFEFMVDDLIRYTPTGDKEHDIRVITQMYTSALEKMIRKDPSQWLWAHRRWLNIHRRPRQSAEASMHANLKSSGNGFTA